MKCPICEGEGRFEVEEKGVVLKGVYYRCPHCDGKGITEPLTNEEWFCSLSTEEKANFLLRIFGNCGWCRDGGNPKFCPTDFENSCLFEDDGLVKWLKEKHDAY